MNINRSHCPLLSSVHLFQWVGSQRVREMDKTVMNRIDETWKSGTKMVTTKGAKVQLNILCAKWFINSTVRNIPLKSKVRTAINSWTFPSTLRGSKHNRRSITILKLWYHTKGSWILLVTKLSWSFGELISFSNITLSPFRTCRHVLVQVEVPVGLYICFFCSKS